MVDYIASNLSPVSSFSNDLKSNQIFYPPKYCLLAKVISFTNVCTREIFERKKQDCIMFTTVHVFLTFSFTFCFRDEDVCV